MTSAALDEQQNAIADDPGADPIEEFRSPATTPFILVCGTTKLDALMDAGLYDMPVVWLRDGENGTFQCTSETLWIPSTYSVASAPLTWCVAAVASDGASAVVFDRLQEARAARAAEGFPPVVLVGSGQGPGEAHLAVARRCLQMLQHAHGVGVGLHEDLSVLRLEYEALQSVFGAVEAWLSTHPPRMDLTFSWAPTAREFSLPAQARVSLRQHLPLPSTGIARIDLLLGPSALEASGCLRARLRCEETDVELAVWDVSVAQLSEPKVSLLLSRALAGARRSLSLALQYEGPESSVLPLVLGTPHLGGVPVYEGPGAKPDSPLAILLWTTIPGTVPPAELTDWRSNEDTQPGQVGHVTVANEWLTAAVALMTPRRQLPELKPLTDIGQLQVHPLKDELAIAYLPAAVPKDAREVAIDISLGHESAPPVDFRLEVAEEELGYKEVAELAKLAERAGSTGWARLNATASVAQLRLSLAAGTKSRHAYLITRTGPKGRTAYAWARFANLRFGS